MLELQDTWDCNVRDLGEGNIRMIVWGSQNSNPQYLVRLYGSGRMVVVDQSDLTVHGNPGDARDVPPKGESFAEQVKAIHDQWVGTTRDVRLEPVDREAFQMLRQAHNDGNQCYVVPVRLEDGIRDIALSPNELRRGMKVKSRSEWLQANRPSPPKQMVPDGILNIIDGQPCGIPNCPDCTPINPS